MSHLIFENGCHIPWSTLKDLHLIPSTQYFTRIQVLDATPDDWKILAKQWCGGRGAGGATAPSDNFLGTLKSVIANEKYYTKYVKSSLSTNSKIAGISIAIQLSKRF